MYSSSVLTSSFIWLVLAASIAYGVWVCSASMLSDQSPAVRYLGRFVLGALGVTIALSLPRG